MVGLGSLGAPGVLSQITQSLSSGTFQKGPEDGSLEVKGYVVEKMAFGAAWGSHKLSTSSHCTLDEKTRSHRVF